MKPKKSLGQNFLRDNAVLRKIISASDLKSDDFVIEIGPGEGVLTEKLIKNAGKIIAIEKDDALASKLDSRFRGNDKIRIIHDDILKINLPKLLSNYKLEAGSYKLIANIPYYITSPIIQLFLETELPPSEMILMVQREVAERICSSPREITIKNENTQRTYQNKNLNKNKSKQSISRGKSGQMSILAVSVQYYSKPEILFEVDRKSFYPVPEVDSAVIKISKIKDQGSRNTKEETKKFFRIVKAGFSAKRKTLLNNLSSSLQIEKDKVEEILKRVGIKPIQRAQELSVEDWKKLATLIYE